MFTSGGRGYIFDLADDTFYQIDAEHFPANVIACAFIQTYFLALPGELSPVPLLSTVQRSGVVGR